jgi:aspartyl protease family protein
MLNSTKSFAVLFGWVLLTTAAPATERVTIVALFSGKALINIDGKRHLMAKGESVGDVKLLAASARGARLEVNGVADDYPLGTGISATFKSASKGRPVRLYPASDGIYRAEGAINGRSVRFAVDTGATLIAMSAPAADRLGLPYRERGVASTANTAGGVVRTFELMLDTVRVGHIKVRNVLGSVIDGDFPDEVLLGNSFLERIKMSREGSQMDLSERGY